MGKNYQEALKLRAKRSSNPIEDYFAGDHPRLAAVRKLTLENIVDRPLEVGQMVGQRIRQLAVTQGFVISELGNMTLPDGTQAPSDQFGYHPDGANPPTVFLPKFEAVWDTWPDEGSVALAHYLFLWVGMKSGNYDCCEAGDLQQPTFSFAEVRKRLINVDRETFTASINHHWYQASVWSRQFFGTNKLYQGAMAEIIQARDKLTGFFMPNVTDILMEYPDVPNELLWTPMERQFAMDLVKGEPVVKTK